MFILTKGGRLFFFMGSISTHRPKIDSETAKKVAMSNTGLRNYNCVTLDGDFYRADGVLSGGANTNKPVLRMIQEYL